jgi:hypothetical protein
VCVTRFRFLNQLTEFRATLCALYPVRAHRNALFFNFLRELIANNTDAQPLKAVVTPALILSSYVQ